MPCACANALASTPKTITLHRNPAIDFMAATFPGGGLPDAGFLDAIVTPGFAARPPDKFTQSHRNESRQIAAGATIELPKRHGFGYVLGAHRH